MLALKAITAKSMGFFNDKMRKSSKDSYSYIARTEYEQKTSIEFHLDVLAQIKYQTSLL